jgi:hypothetical protein
MKAGNALIIVLMAGSFTLGACESKVKVEDRSDTATTGVGRTIDTATTNVGNAIDSAGQKLGDEAIEKKVEVKLMGEPGFSEVDVSSKPDGIIVLTGTAASEAE